MPVMKDKRIFRRTDGGRGIWDGEFGEHAEGKSNSEPFDDEIKGSGSQYLFLDVWLIPEATSTKRPRELDLNITAIAVAR